MEKLIELLNEYSKIRNNARIVEWVEHTKGNLYWEYWENAWSYMVVISKEYGFIKWLVDNDKIRDGGIRPRKDLVKEIVIVDYKTGDAIGWKNKYTEVEQFIMYLSIQDEPIRFLCEILK